MGIYNAKSTDYSFLPLWRCQLCNLEMECLSKGRSGQVMTAHTAHRRFKKKHDREKPNCPGKLKYVPGVKKPERQ